MKKQSIYLTVLSLAMSLTVSACGPSDDAGSFEGGSHQSSFQGHPGAANNPGSSADGSSFNQSSRESIPAPSDVAGIPADAESTPNGVGYIVLEDGNPSGKRPSPTDLVRVHYTGWTTDGNMFDSSVVRGEPATFSLNAVIPGWTEAVSMMQEGEIRRIWIPQELAYNGRSGAPAGMLVFDIQLIEVL